MITDGRDLPAITCPLESSPVLEKLTLSMKPSDNRRFERAPHHIVKSWTSKERFCKCLSFHPKNIEIVESQPRFAGSNFFCSLVEFLLKNAKPFVCVSWPKLNVLTIGYANQSNEIVAQSLSGIPMLEFLRLQRCNGINRLIVISSNFKELLIDGPRERFSSTWFVMAILTPN
ncbi:hypothetical protein WN944_012175 [Citrus x changshan-huyou]|uniref:Uncharacterized protein n=1 Tax=Citrus x changshan-huyou TaxID=2935761 RepID=A0AAP0MZG6_9ROSI